MAGHFLLQSISQSDVNTICAQIGARISARQHANVGWTAKSQATLNRILHDELIPNRNNLPPHVYLQVDSRDAAAMGLLRGAGWTDRLRRPASAGFGLRALCEAAQQCWDAGDYAGALAAQVAHGSVSIEIYYMSGMRV